MLKQPIITLTTDFGLKDPFVGIMKGVIMGINPHANIVDITHNISRHNILEAAHVLSMSYRFFPSPSVHVVVVDPGVGGSRRPIMVITLDHYFIGPDNGIFSQIYQAEASSFMKVIHLTATHHFQPMGGSTFDGRDVFAPVAAWFSKGISSSKFGDEITDYVTIPESGISHEEGCIVRGEVVLIDSFGNAITNIKRKNFEKILAGHSEGRLRVVYRNQHLSLVHYYEDSGASERKLSALVNSFGLLELFLLKGNAAEEHKISIGDEVRVALI